MHYLPVLPPIHAEKAGDVMLWKVCPVLPEHAFLVLAQTTERTSGSPHNLEKKTLFLQDPSQHLNLDVRHVNS